MRITFYTSSKTSVLGILSLMFCIYTIPAWSLEEADEYALKAVFLFNLAKFISWPSNTFQNEVEDNQQKFHFCILGDTKFNGEMEETIEAETVRSRDVEVEKDIALDVSSYRCQIIFISEFEEDRLPEILDFYRGRPILTVSDLEGFAENEGMVEFYKQNSRIRLAINAKSLREANLKANANLLRVAKILSADAIESQ